MPITLARVEKILSKDQILVKSGDNFFIEDTFYYNGAFKEGANILKFIYDMQEKINGQNVKCIYISEINQN